MKTNLSQTSYKQGFTLIELLVVIAIIASLASLGFVGAKGAMEKAYKTTSVTHLTNITSGINAFYADYNVYPTGANDGSLGRGAGDSSEVTNGAGLIQILAGAEPGALPENKRNIKYIDGMEANAAGNNGINYTSFTFTDYWGNNYEAIWDGDYDGLLNDPFGGATELRRSSVAAGQGTSTAALSSNMSPKDQTQVTKTW